MVLHIYSIVILRQSITELERTVLRFYIKSGYDDQVRKTILLDTKITPPHLRQINCKLTKKGYLERHPTNYRKKNVSPKLLELHKVFLNKETNIYSIVFEKANDIL